MNVNLVHYLILRVTVSFLVLVVRSESSMRYGGPKNGLVSNSITLYTYMS